VIFNTATNQSNSKSQRSNQFHMDKIKSRPTFFLVPEDVSLMDFKKEDGRRVSTSFRYRKSKEKYPRNGHWRLRFLEPQLSIMIR